jgi:sulfate adenylyltransferase
VNRTATRASGVDRRHEIRLDPIARRDLAQLLAGGYAPLDGFQTEEAAALVRRRGTLADGSPWPLPITLGVDREVAGQVRVGDEATLRDPDGTVLASLEVRSRWQDASGWHLGGPVAPAQLGRPTVDFPSLPRGISDLPAAMREPSSPLLALQPSAFVDARTAARMRRVLDRWGARALLLPPLGTDPERRHVHRIRSYRALAEELGSERTALRLLESGRCPEHPDAAALHAVVARNAGATHLVVTSELGQQAATRAGLLVVDLATFAQTDDPPPDVFTPATDEARRRADPPRHERGLVVLLTGLSGSGKSTIARILRTRLVEGGHRSVTLLDGDLVRQHLSSELSFTREHRDLNVTRIGWVASEIAKHGGIAICAPIAPYRTVRGQVRQQAEEVDAGFVLVHVATPLAVCEARDVKGLYAKARAGELRGFTGIDDPYEVPHDAEVVVDTSVASPGAAAETIIASLERAGWYRPA